PIGKLSTEVSLEYNFSDTNSKTKSEMYAYTATPQNIRVPANSSVEVVVMLNKVKAQGKVNLFSRISGSYDPFINHSYYPASGEKYGKAYIHQDNYGQTVRYAKNFTELPYLSVNSDDSVNIKGKGTYEAEVGTEFSVTVNPIKNQKSRSVDGGYTFKVKPQIQKLEK
ncbi:ETX/MTX2 family pore-forming toxin, partial [Bacillus thuringiensis]|nr:ETX/MTX2 family pore-forming toxin [Bacillus thuringiensis]